MTLLMTAYGVAPIATVVVLLCALAGAGIAVERAVVVARSRLSGNGRPFMERIVALVQAGQVDEALTACSNTHAILPDIGLVVLRARLREEADLKAIASAAVASTTPRLGRRLRYVPAFTTAAVCAGAAGFLVAYMGEATERAVAPLALALALAGPLVVAHAFVANQVDAILAQSAEFVGRLVNALLDRPDVRLGHR